jgi:two-component system sensor histidine kinase/response regulator
MVYELQVHQIELQLQNEELRCTQAELTEIRDKFFELFEFAPVGYVTIGSDYGIDHCNLSATELLGMERGKVEGSVLSALVAPQDQDLCFQAVSQAVESGVRQTCECAIARPTGTVRHIQLAIAPRNEQRPADGCRVTLSDITRRKQSELELERTRNQLSEAQRIAHLGSWEYVSATRETVWSDEQKRIYGLDPTQPSPVYEEMLRRHIHPDDVAELDRRFREAIASGGTFENENRIVRPDGSVRFIYNKAQPYFDQAGRLVRYVGATLDITERKRAEAALLASEARFHTYVDHVADSLFVHDMSGRLLDANAHACQSLGYSREELLRMSVCDIETEFEVPQVQEISSQTVPGETVTLNGRHRRKDGSTFPVESRIGRLDLAEQSCCLASVRDVTERERREAEIRQAEERLRFALDGARLGSWHVDLVTQQLTWSDTYRALFGHTPESEPSYENWLSCLHPADRDAAAAATRRAVVERGAFAIEYRVQWSDGTEHWINDMGRVYCDANGEPQRMDGVALDITARKKNELELLQLNERLELAKRAAGQGVWDWDIATGQLNWSPEMFHLFGMDRDRQTDSFAAWEAALHPEDRPAALTVLEQSLRDRTLFNTEYRVLHRDGQVRWIGSTGRAAYDDAGRAIRMTGICMDVTERRAMLEKIQQWNAELERTVAARTTELTAAQAHTSHALERVAASEARFRAIFEQAPVGVALIDPLTGQIHEANSRFAEITGRTREQMATIDWRGITHPDDVQEDEDTDNMARLNADEIPGYQMNKRCVRPDGSLVWISMAIAPVTTPNGKDGRHLCMIEDVTERKKAEDRLHDALQRLQLANTAGNVGSWTWNLSNDIIEWDDRLCEWYGIPPADRKAGLYHEFWRSRVHPDDLAPADAILHGSVQSGVGAEVNFRFAKPGDRLRFVQSTWVVERDASGKTARLIGITRDMTAHHDAEEELRAAKQAADDANRAKSSFLANMSHEIRTPMNGVIGMTGLLMGTELNDQQRRCAEAIRSSGESLLALINDILDFSKIEASKLDLETLDFDLRSLLGDFAAPLAVRAEEKGLKFTWAVEPEVPHQLRGDPGRLRQILTNLAGNAIKFTERGQISVRASLMLDTATDAVVRFTVCDTGIGISPEKQSRLFKRFAQGDSSTTRRHGGTGLGLAISKQLTELMGGEIGVSSRAGAGSEFWFTVRLGKSARLQSPAAATPEPASLVQPQGTSRPAMLRQRARILVVEDNIINQEVAVGILRRLGLQAEAVADGVEAIEALKTLPFDLVLMDMQMPEMDGLEATQIIRDPNSAVPNHQIPVIAMTAAAMQGDRESCLEAGMNDYISKPVSPQALIEVLNTWLPPEHPDF